MTLFRYIVSVPLILLSVYGITVNISILFHNWFRRKNYVSWVPCIGGLLGVAGVLTLPQPFVHRYWAAPLVLDVGCIPLLSYTLVWHAIRALRKVP